MKKLSVLLAVLVIAGLLITSCAPASDPSPHRGPGQGCRAHEGSRTDQSA